MSQEVNEIHLPIYVQKTCHNVGEGVGTALWDGLQDSDINPKEPHIIGPSCVVHGVPWMTYRA